LSHLLFLSHAGIDTEAASALVARIEGAPAAREHGLKVWIDRRDLRVGAPWKRSVQFALDESTAFAVYLGSRGVMNWIWDEVGVALDRAHKDPHYPVITLFGTDCSPDELPGFLAQYQGVGDLDDPEAFGKLLRAVLKLDPRAPIRPEADPFVGLSTYHSPKAHLFRGRTAEVDALLEVLRSEPLVMIVGDSGSGKSSLVRAGLIPAFRGGRLAGPRAAGPDSTVWLALETRPGTDPFGQLADDVRDAAVRLGRSDASSLAGLVRQTGRLSGTPRDPAVVRDALLSCVPPGATGAARVLLLIDQFEEIATSPDAKEYVDLIVALGSDRIRVVLTMRLDYYYLCASFPSLYDRLEQGQRRARYQLGRMSPEGLREAIVSPLEFGGVDRRIADAFAQVVLRDVGDQPGDLALLQMALWRTWLVRPHYGYDLLAAYRAIGRVEGALAEAAHEVYQALNPEDQSRAETLFVRLVRPGEAGTTATRRVAQLDELDEATRDLARALAKEDRSRLVMVGQTTVEIAHEQLATQWMQYQRWIRNAPSDPRGDDLRVLHELIRDSARGQEAAYLARGHDLKLYLDLLRRRPTWLSTAERHYVERSEAVRIEEESKERRSARRLRTLTWVSSLVALVAVCVTSIGCYLWILRNRARGATQGAFAQLLLSQRAYNSSVPVVAALAAEGWRNGPTSDAWNALQRINYARQTFQLRDLTEGSFADSSQGLTFGLGRPEAVILADGIVTIGPAEIKRQVSVASARLRLQHDGPIVAFLLSPDGRTVATAGADATVRRWTLVDGRELRRYALSGEFSSLRFSPDGQTLASWTKEGTIQVWTEHAQLARVDVPRGLTGAPWALANGGDKIAVQIGQEALIFAAGDGRALARVPVPNGVKDVAFSQDGRRLTVLDKQGYSRICSSQSGRELIGRHHANDAVLSPDGRTVAWSDQMVDDAPTLFIVSILSLMDGRKSRLDLRELDPETGLDAISFTPDGSSLDVATHQTSGGSAIGTVERWSFDLDARAESVEWLDEPLTDLQYHFQTKTEIQIAGSSARVFSSERYLELARIDHGARIVKAAITADGKLAATAGHDGKVRLWSLGTSSAQAIFEVGDVLALAFSPRSDRLNVLVDGELVGLPVVARVGRTTIPVAREETYAATFSADGQWLLAVDDMSASLLDVARNTPAQAATWDSFDPDFNRVSALAVAPGGGLLAVGQVASPTLLLSTSGPPSSATPQPTAGAEKQLREMARLGDSGAAALAFSRDGGLLAAGGSDGVIRLVRIPEGREVARIDVGAAIVALAFEDPRRLVAADTRGVRTVWSTRLDLMLSRICAAPGRNLSRAEWARSGYLADVPWRPVCDSWATSQ
jgi:WD40 repeat protein